LDAAQPVRINIVLDGNIIGQVNNFKHFHFEISTEIIGTWRRNLMGSASIVVLLRPK
jgi:hypothetical protein